MLELLVTVDLQLLYYPWGKAVLAELGKPRWKAFSYIGNMVILYLMTSSQFSTSRLCNYLSLYCGIHDEYKMKNRGSKWHDLDGLLYPNYKLYMPTYILPHATSFHICTTLLRYGLCTRLKVIMHFHTAMQERNTRCTGHTTNSVSTGGRTII